MCDECRTACEHDAVIARAPAEAPPVAEPAPPASAGNAALARAMSDPSANPQLLRSVIGRNGNAAAAAAIEAARRSG